jgi:hypothetical protein
MPMVKLILLLSAFLVCLVPAPASANMANPVQTGDPVGEPSGDLKAIAIAREDLRLDLRPLAADQPALIDATYQVRNAGGTTPTDLLFVAPALAETGAGVWLDGSALAFQRTRPATLPPSWQPPATTPGIAGADLRYQTPTAGALRFAITLPPGDHQIRVHYSARATAYSDGSPTRYWQIGYVLAPARQWASFGQLAVSVNLPPGWLAASRPVLTRSGDDLAGAFDGVPADALALTVQSPPPRIEQRGPQIAVGGFLAAILIGMLGGLALRRAKRRILWLLPIAVIVGAGWALSTLGAETVVGVVPDAQRAWTYGYGQAPASGASWAALAAGVLVVQGCAWLVSRAARHRAVASADDGSDTEA